jgi:hypothetical protein
MSHAFYIALAIIRVVLTVLFLSAKLAAWLALNVVVPALRRPGSGSCLLPLPQPAARSTGTATNRTTDRSFRLLPPGARAKGMRT